MDITMPQLGESVTEGTITKWLKSPGDRVEKYEPICEVATDKVNAEVPSSIEGIFHEVLAEEGQTVEVGHFICRIRGIEETEKKETREKKVRYSPAVLRLAEEHAVDLTRIQGTGRDGRITRKDILSFIEKVPTQPQEPLHEDVPSINRPQVQKPSLEKREDGDTEIPLTPVRKTIAERMVQSKQEIPHAWLMMEADVTSLVQTRERLKKEFQEREGVSLTFVPFFIKAVVDALKEFPHLNAVWNGQSILVKKHIHISVAVATEEALFVPVIHNADEKSILGLQKAVHQIVEKTRSGKLDLKDMQGGTFTVNNTGSFGSIASTPIINHPQAAILSFESIVRRPVVIDNMIALRDQMNLCLSIDHRIVDGLMAGRFLGRVKRQLESYRVEDVD